VAAFNRLEKIEFEGFNEKLILIFIFVRQMIFYSNKLVKTVRKLFGVQELDYFFVAL